MLYSKIRYVGLKLRDVNPHPSQNAFENVSILKACKPKRAPSTRRILHIYCPSPSRILNDHVWLIITSNIFISVPRPSHRSCGVLPVDIKDLWCLKSRPALAPTEREVQPNPTVQFQRRLSVLGLREESRSLLNLWRSEAHWCVRLGELGRWGQRSLGSLLKDQICLCQNTQP